ncbi:MAG: glutathione S-transferase family protein [Alphaproteobacteria bacterium]|nr:glutathione S-transferase family protein [Alphaproteobacteria bacterium]
MAVYSSRSAEAAALKGVHLYHFVFSNCSQRVRIALEAKGVAWQSHHVDLASGAHLTPGYLEINPNAVVPSLVHDGTVILESNDIIAYIDAQFDGPPLMPAGADDREAVQKLIDLASGAQAAIKALSHELLFKRVRKVSAADVDGMAAVGAPAALVDFMRDFSEDGAAWAERVARARTDIDERLGQLEARLAHTGHWLSGPEFGLADISWVVNAFRLQQCGYDIARYPRVIAWCRATTALPAFKRAVSEYKP